VFQNQYFLSRQFFLSSLGWGAVDPVGGFPVTLGPGVIQPDRPQVAQKPLNRGWPGFCGRLGCQVPTKL